MQRSHKDDSAKSGGATNVAVILFRKDMRSNGGKKALISSHLINE